MIHGSYNVKYDIIGFITNLMGRIYVWATQNTLKRNSKTYIELSCYKQEETPGWPYEAKWPDLVMNKKINRHCLRLKSNRCAVFFMN